MFGRKSCRACEEERAFMNRQVQAQQRCIIKSMELEIKYLREELARTPKRGKGGKFKKRGRIPSCSEICLINKIGGVL